MDVASTRWRQPEGGASREGIDALVLQAFQVVATAIRESACSAAPACPGDRPESDYFIQNFMLYFNSDKLVCNAVIH